MLSKPLMKMLIDSISFHFKNSTQEKMKFMEKNVKIFGNEV